jgi:hypothetical protein
MFAVRDDLSILFDQKLAALSGIGDRAVRLSLSAAATVTKGRRLAQVNP